MLVKIKRLLNRLQSINNNMHNIILYKIKNVSFETKPQVNGKLFIYRNGEINLGKEVKINSAAKHNPIGGDLRMVFSVDKGAKLTIGNNTGLSNSTIVCKNKVTIGNYVKIGGSVKIYDTDFHALNYEARSNPKTDIGITKPVEIKDHAFIGAHSIILKGVTIGERSIIGAGSVVTKSVPNNQIWAGNPAKFIKEIS